MENIVISYIKHQTEIKFKLQFEFK